MFSKIITAENYFNELLPANQLQNGVPVALFDAGRKWSDSVWTIAVQLGPMPLTTQQMEDGHTLAQKPVFICGVHRSGTTLLKDILDGHPELVVLPSEGTFYTNQESKLAAMPQNEWAGYLGKEWLRRLANPINQPPYWLLGRSDNENFLYVNFARYVMAWWEVLRQEPGTQWPHMAIILAYASCTNNLSACYWVDKTPTNEQFIERIWREMPSAKIMHMVREPIATLTSRRQMEPTISLRNALRFLKTSFSIAASQHNSQQYLVIRYEDLCSKPEITTAQIANFLNVEALATLHQPSVAGKPSQANSSFNKQSQPGLILKPDQHRQQANLTNTEQKLVAAVMGDVAKKHNYKLQHLAVIPRLLLKWRYLIR